MKKYFAAFLLAIFCPPAVTGFEGGEAIPGRYIVCLRAGTVLESYTEALGSPADLVT